jgi:hypothetical protein
MNVTLLGIKCTAFSPKRENDVQWEFQLNSALPTPEIWDLEDRVLTVNL